jgi:hypothetical protein
MSATTMQQQTDMDQRPPALSAEENRRRYRIIQEVTSDHRSADEVIRYMITDSGMSPEAALQSFEGAVQQWTDRLLKNARASAGAFRNVLARGGRILR